EACDDVAGRWIGHYCVAASSFQLAAFTTAREHFQKALALDDLEQARIASSSTGLDLGVHILNFFSRTLAVLGLPHQPRFRRDELLVRGSAFGHTASQPHASVPSLRAC